MNNLSNYIEAEILNHVLRGRPHVKAASYWYTLFSANPGDGGDLTVEINGGGFARVEAANNKINFPQCLATGIPTKTNGESILFPYASATQGTATHWGLFNAPIGLTFSGTTVSGNESIAVADTTPLRVGMSITGAGVPLGSVIASIITNTSIAISNSDPALADTCTASATVTITVVPKFIAYSALDKKILIKSGKSPKLPSGSIDITLPQSPLGGLTRYGQVKVLDHIFGHLAFPSPASVYSGFGTAWTAGGAVNDIFVEFDDSGYSRQTTVFGAPVGGTGTLSNTSVLSFTGVDGVADGAATITSVGIWDDDNSGNLLYAGSERKSFTVANSNLIKTMASQLIISIQ